MPTDHKTANLNGTRENPLVVKPEKPFEKPQEVISWEAVERIFKNRSPIWLLSLSVSSVGVLVVLLLAGQWTLALAVVAAAFLFATINLVEPPARRYSITTTGVRFGQKLYNFYDLESFWFHQKDGYQTLCISTFLSYPNLIEIPLPDQTNETFIQQIETSLLRHIPIEEGKKHRDLLGYLDNAMARVSPWLPKPLVNWYMKKIGQPRSA